MIEIIDKIYDINKELSKRVSYINNGGCGKYALFLSEQLINKNIKHDIVVFSSKTNIKTIKKYIKNKKHEYYDISFHHVMIKIDKFYIDGETIYKERPYEYKTYYKGKLKHGELKFSVENGDWNSDYNNKQNKRVQAIIKKYLK